MGADAYIVKPVKSERLLALVAEKLEEQNNAERMTQEKVTEWIKTRVSKLKNERALN